MRLALVGWGAIGRTVGAMLENSDVEIVGVAVRDASAARSGLPPSAIVITDPVDLAALRPDVVAEAAGRDSVAPWGMASLEAGADFVVSSVSAFADGELLKTLRAAAASFGGQIQIQPGALGGVDALAAARLMGIDHVDHRITKPPLAWSGTEAEVLCSLFELTGPREFFTASAAETAQQFPKNANVAMTTALAGIGPEATRVTLVADPEAKTNQHHIEAYGAFGTLSVTVANNPLPDSPKTSAMAALNLARAIQNRVDPIVI